MQLDAKTRVEAALDHPLAVHFEDARRCKTSHQRLTHSAGVRTRLGGEQQRFAHCFDGQRYDDLVRDLAGLAVAVASHERDVLAHQLE